MTGILAQLVSLVSYGNQSLITGVLPTDYYPENSVFRFCNAVDFLDIQDDKEVRLTPYAVNWFGYLKTGGCQRLLLYYRPANGDALEYERQLAGMVGGGGIWLIEAVYAGYSDYWSNRWQVTKKDDPDGRIWSVAYGRTNTHLATTEMQFDLPETAASLNKVLTAIADFASRQELDNWKDIFTTALDRLHSSMPEEGYYHQDLLVPASYSLAARQLLLASSSAWVFGGMGSWNDLSFEKEEDNQHYEALSTTLYNAVNRGILAAANSSTATRLTPTTL
jgi:hypothetical protein